MHIKKLFLSLIVILSTLLYVPCFAQFNAYHPFPDSNASWCEHYWWIAAGCTGKGSIVQANKYYDYYVNGDTVVNGKTYIKIRTSGGYEEAPPCPPPIVWLNYDNLACLIREDNTAKKVYASFPPHLGTDTLLYDFTLTQGNYLPQGYLSDSSDSTFVYSVDSVLAGNFYRKRFNIARDKSHLLPFTSIIEGIGSMEGLLERLEPPFESGNNMDCFSSSPIHYPNYDSCSRFVLSTENIIAPVSSISIYPNPSNGIFNLGLRNKKQGISEMQIEIYNVMGQEVYFKTLKQVQGDYSINLSTQPNGVYFYRVMDENSNLIGEGKLVIQR